MQTCGSAGKYRGYGSEGPWYCVYLKRLEALVSTNITLGLLTLLAH